ncbi:MAG: hypothetical protein EHM39_04320, partial [Chloroflexi bacterium]
MARTDTPWTEAPVKHEIINLAEKETYHQRGPWIDAWRRLRRNRAAIIGLVIIVLNILVAFFASSIAPHSFRTQELYDAQTGLAMNNTSPEWVTRIFTTMKAIKRDRWTFEGTAGDTLNIDVGSPNLDKGMPTVGAARTGFTTNVHVLAPNGENLAAKQGTTLDFGSHIQGLVLPATGTYTLIVQRHTPGERGEYALSITR